MPRYILKVDKEETNTPEDLYMEWSSVVDCPTSPLMPLEDFREWYEWRYQDKAKDFLERMERVERTGTSAIPPHITFEDLISFNRAGENETELTREELIEKYKDI